MDSPLYKEDPYFWLRDDSRKNQKVLDHINQENEYTDSTMKSHENDIKKLYDELLSHVKEDEKTLPLPHGKGDWDSEYYYFVKRVKGQSYPLHYRINRKTSQEELLLEKNLLANGKETFDLTNFEITEDHKFMSYGIDETGNEKYDLKIININTKEELSHNIPELSYCSYFWYQSNIYYLVGDDKNRLYQFWKYDFQNKINTKIFEVNDELIDLNASLSEDKSHIFIYSNSYETDDVYCLLLNDDQLTVKQFTPKINGHKYDVSYHNGLYFVTTNIKESSNFKIMISEEIGAPVTKWNDFIH